MVRGQALHPYLVDHQYETIRLYFSYLIRADAVACGTDTQEATAIDHHFAHIIADVELEPCNFANFLIVAAINWASDPPLRLLCRGHEDGASGHLRVCAVTLWL